MYRKGKERKKREGESKRRKSQIRYFTLDVVEDYQKRYKGAQCIKVINL